MLSSPRLTLWDLMILVLFLSLTGRVLAPADQMQHAFAVQSDPVAPMIQVLAHPLPDAETSPALTRPAMLDATLRCLGLSDAQRRARCSLTGAGCSSDQVGFEDIANSLWPKGYVGDFAGDFLRRVELYSQAYAALHQRDMVNPDEHSKLILNRDNAMCRRYQAYFEARLYEHQDRQPS